MNRIPCVHVMLIVVAMVAPWIAGCKSSVELPPQATRDLLDLRDRAIAAKQQIQLTSNAARDLLQKPTQTDPLVGRLLGQIDGLTALAAQSRSDMARSDQRTSDYLAKWEEDLKSMSEDVSKPGEQRLAQAKASYQTLKDMVADVRADFTPFVSDLDEISRYLKTDGTAAGVQVVKPKIEKSLEREPRLMKKIDAVIAQIDSMRGGK